MAAAASSLPIHPASVGRLVDLEQDGHAIKDGDPVHALPLVAAVRHAPVDSGAVHLVEVPADVGFEQPSEVPGERLPEVPQPGVVDASGLTLRIARPGTGISSMSATPSTTGRASSGLNRSRRASGCTRGDGWTGVRAARPGSR